MFPVLRPPNGTPTTPPPALALPRGKPPNRTPTTQQPYARPRIVPVHHSPAAPPYPGVNQETTARTDSTLQSLHNAITPLYPHPRPPIHPASTRPAHLHQRGGGTPPNAAKRPNPTPSPFLRTRPPASAHPCSPSPCIRTRTTRTVPAAFLLLPRSPSYPGVNQKPSTVHTSSHPLRARLLISPCARLTPPLPQRPLSLTPHLTCPPACALARLTPPVNHHPVSAALAAFSSLTPPGRPSAAKPPTRALIASPSYPGVNQKPALAPAPPAPTPRPVFPVLRPPTGTPTPTRRTLLFLPLGLPTQRSHPAAATGSRGAPALSFQFIPPPTIQQQGSSPSYRGQTSQTLQHLFPCHPAAPSFSPYPGVNHQTTHQPPAAAPAGEHPPPLLFTPHHCPPSTLTASSPPPSSCALAPRRAPSDPSRQLPNKSESQQIDKSKSRQIGKHATNHPRRGSPRVSW